MSRLSVALVAGSAIIIILAGATLGPRPAAAQLVCGVSATGADPQTGAGATATGTEAIACGSSAHASGGSSAVFGPNAGSSSGASTFNSSWFGLNAGTGVAGGGNSAFGNNSGSIVTGTNNSAFGTSAGVGVTGNSNTAAGNLAGVFVVGNSNSAFGDGAGAQINGSNNVAVGTNAGSGPNGGPAIAVSNTVAIGNNAVASANGGVAIGNGAQATRENQVVLGISSYTYTTPGITSAASRAAQTGPTQIVTSDAGGNLATSTLASLGVATTADIGAINSRLDDLTTRSNKAYTGVAMAFAMAGVPTLLPSEKLAMAVNWGTFEGANGLALNAALRLHDQVQLNGGIGYGPDQHIAGGRVGLRVGF